MFLLMIIFFVDDDNIGSAKVIENNGGILENKVEIVIEGKLLLQEDIGLNYKYDII